MTASPACLGTGRGLARDHRLVDVGVPVDDLSVGRHSGAGPDEHDVVDLQGADRHLLGAIGGHPLGRVRQQRGEGRERALGLGDRAHLEPVAQAA